MLDAVAGYVTKRIRARHVAAVCQPADVAAILNAYAHLQHNTVVRMCVCVCTSLDGCIESAYAGSICVQLLVKMHISFGDQ